MTASDTDTARHLALLDKRWRQAARAQREEWRGRGNADPKRQLAAKRLARTLRAVRMVMTVTMEQSHV